jgi:hypothetical protein
MAAMSNEEAELACHEPNETHVIEAIALSLGIPTSVAMDIFYLRELEKRIIIAAQQNPSVKRFNVYNEALEGQLSKLGV